MAAIIALGIAVLGFFSLSMLVPAVAALLTADWVALEAILLVAVGYGFVAVLSFFALWPRLRRLNRGGLFRMALVMWLTLVAAAVPLFLLLEHRSPVSALFEAVSAVTTLGVSFVPPSKMSVAMAYYRAILGWQGGLLTLLLAIYVLGRTGTGGMPNRHLRFVLHSFEAGDPRILHTFMEVFVPYSLATLFGTALLVLTHVPAAQSFGIALSMISTNGFLPVNAGHSILDNVAGEMVMIVMMVAGATSMLWQRALVARKWHQLLEQNESLLFIATLSGLSALVVTVSLALPEGRSGGVALAFNRVFDLVSTMTSTGVVHTRSAGFGLPFEFALGLAFVGGCSFSTAGGLKFFRFVGMLHHSFNEVRRLVFPHAILVHSPDTDPEETGRTKAIWSAFYLSVLAVLGAAIAFSVHGYGLDHSLGLAIGAFSSTASLVETGLANGPHATVPNETLLTLSLVALAGRIELLAVIAAFGRLRF